jgi:hypothetical protein
VEIFLKGLFQRMGIKAKPEITEADGVVSVDLTGEDRACSSDCAENARRDSASDQLCDQPERIRARARQHRYGKLQQRRYEALERLADKWRPRP